MIREFDRHNSVCHVLLIRTSLTFHTGIRGVGEANMISKKMKVTVYSILRMLYRRIVVTLSRWSYHLLFVNMRVC